ncbi:hypothetical protein NCER_100327 [Vairimorpha ceranae BRL01]|uniref:T-complex protein 1 subunit epsilon n=1 Tax=Vairimorpha ceranae (strain BRL01) TaxID=578460 RepID=C4V7A5_VAIC1|nr:hypothetical protein NCER_100327 [Vairimorpha ceranae BRL01]
MAYFITKNKFLICNIFTLMSQLLTDEIGQAFEVTDESNIRLHGLTTINTNISVVNNITNFISTSFGPCGMDKILQSKDDEITVTNDGATILKEMDMTDNDIAKLFVQLSESQDNEIGDGTTGVLILANGLLQNSKQLMDKGIHPIRIAEFYDSALSKAIEHLKNISESINNKKEAMLNAARTSLHSKVVSKAIDKFANICVEAILSVADIERQDVDFSLINYEKRIGCDVAETELVRGMVIKKEFSHPQMKKEFKNVKIALLACPFEPPKLKNKHNLLIKNPEEYKALQKYEREVFLDMIKIFKRC